MFSGITKLGNISALLMWTAPLKTFEEQCILFLSIHIQEVHNKKNIHSLVGTLAMAKRLIIIRELGTVG